MLKIFAGRSSQELGKDIARHLGLDLGKINIRTFPDSEIHVQVEESIRGKNVYVVQSTSEPVNGNLMELLIIADALKRASAKSVTAIIPYFGYGRQDHKTTGREPITARLVADLIEASCVDQIVSVDLHSTQLQGFFNIPVVHITALPILVNYFRALQLENLVVVSPDVGRAKLADKFADMLKIPLVIMNKKRIGVAGEGGIETEIIGDVSDTTVIINDDIIASGSVVNQAQALLDAGANEVYLAITHPVLVGQAIERLQSNSIVKLITTNSIQLPESKRIPKIEVLSLAHLLSSVIERLNQNLSVSRLLECDFAV